MVVRGVKNFHRTSLAFGHLYYSIVELVRNNKCAHDGEPHIEFLLALPIAYLHFSVTSQWVWREQDFRRFTKLVPEFLSSNVLPAFPCFTPGHISTLVY